MIETAPRGTGLALRGLRFAAFGSEATVEAGGPNADELLAEAAGMVREVSEQLTRFDPSSELSRINSDSRETVEASPLMISFVEAALVAADMSGGLVDPTLLPELERAGYTGSMFGVKPEASGATPSPARDGAGASDVALIQSRRETLSVDSEAGTITRRPGVRLDAGGIGKGLAADLVGQLMEDADAPVWSVDCLGDVRVGGTMRESRPVTIASPFPGEGPIEVLELRRAGVATSGTTKRAWASDEGVHSHHLIDPRTGLPAESDLIQVTAVAPTTVEAEVRAKAGLLIGLSEARRWLPYGGLAVERNGRVHRFGPVQEVA